jgi:hypothetical protein
MCGKIQGFVAPAVLLLPIRAKQATYVIIAGRRQ